MTWSVHITTQAERDIDEAASYIAFTLLNADAAYNLLVTANDVLHSLAHDPKRNRPVDDPLLSSWGIRFIAVKNYLAFYVVSEEDRTVHVIRFLYRKRNWIHLLKQGYVTD